MNVQNENKINQVVITHYSNLLVDLKFPKHSKDITYLYPVRNHSGFSKIYINDPI